MRRLTSAFGSPQDTFEAVHIAGTNGKGSVAIKTAYALQKLGFKTGLFTSPHINTFRERVVVNSQMISEEEVVHYAKQVFDVIEREQISVSFFSIITMIAFLQFRDKQVQYAVVECGIGARLDPTNVITRVSCAAVTSIGYDHTEVLGNTLEDIAREKAGIMKTGVKACVLGKTSCSDKLIDIFTEVAKNTDVKLVQADIPQDSQLSFKQQNSIISQ
jgi:dihydrofolate synthase/folylpolyglutamate synthase